MIGKADSRVVHTRVGRYNCTQHSSMLNVAGDPSPRSGSLGARSGTLFRADQISFWTIDAALVGRLRLAASDVGLCRVALGRESDQAFFSWLYRVMRPRDIIRQRSELIDQALTEIHAYVSGTLRDFATPLEICGTAFQRQVWAEVAGIAYGATVTYGEIAARIGRPKAARAVGAANAANPLPLFVPCHRIVGSDGGLRGYGEGMEIKMALLKLERETS